MDSKTANLMDWVNRSVKKDDTLVFDKFHGRDAVKITLSYDDKGHPKIGAEIWALVRLKEFRFKKSNGRKKCLMEKNIGTKYQCLFQAIWKS